MKIRITIEIDNIKQNQNEYQIQSKINTWNKMKIRISNKDKTAIKITVKMGIK